MLRGCMQSKRLDFALDGSFDDVPASLISLYVVVWARALEACDKQVWSPAMAGCTTEVPAERMLMHLVQP